MVLLAIAAILLLSYVNGSNDNFKGVATLRGSQIAGYRAAIIWGSFFTLLGSLAALWASNGLLETFSGRGIIAGSAAADPIFLTSVALGAGATVGFASKIGAPISTTHAIAGALVGCGLAAVGLEQLDLAALGDRIIWPLLFSPLASLLLTLVIFRPASRFLGSSGACLCLEESEAICVSPGLAARETALSGFRIIIDRKEKCATLEGSVRINFTDGLHWLSAGAMSFARGLNDTPKIAALMLAGIGSHGLNFLLVALAMAAGGILGAMRVARTMSERITPMDPVQGLSANLVTALLVGCASRFGLPVSTTHVSCGSLFGIGLLRRREANWSMVRNIILAWIFTLPSAAAAGIMVYLFLSTCP